VERATLDQFETAYQIVAEYYEVLAVVARETPEEFRREYFARGSGLWLARVGGNLAGSRWGRSRPTRSRVIGWRTGIDAWSTSARATARSACS